MLEEYNDVLCADDLVKILGVSKKTIYKELDSGYIPARRFGKTWRISKEEFIRFLGGNNNTKGQDSSSKSAS